MRSGSYLLTTAFSAALSTLVLISTSSTLSLGLSLYAAQPVAAAASCGHGSKCPSSSPCCSADGACGSGSVACAGGCQALWSNKPTSCLPNPVCQNINLKINSTQYNDTSVFMPILHYDGDASKAPFTLDYGSLGAGQSGVLVQMTQARQGKISTTSYCLHCEVSFTLRHNPRNGLVAAAIGMSDAKDELDWEFTTSSANQALTNWFSLGQVVANSNSGGTQGMSSNLNQFHTFGIDWQSDSIQWKIDGSVVRTLKASDLGDQYPTTPMRFQVSTWAGGNVTNPPGVIDWSGGNIDWSSSEYEQNGFYSQEITKYTMTCPSDANDANLATVGSGSSPTGYVYTGANSSNGRPVVQLSSSPISFLSDPSADGTPNTPGFAIASSDSKSHPNMWDGTGKSAGSSSSGVSWSKTPALRYGVIAGAAVVALILVWALITRLVRAHQHKKLMNSGARITGIGSGFGAPVAAVAAATGVKKSDTRYQPVGDGDDVPMGAAKQGQGYGPAAGPAPGPMAYNYANARPSGRDASQSSAYSAGSAGAPAAGAPYRPGYQAAEYDPYARPQATSPPPAPYATQYSAPYATAPYSSAYPNAAPPRSGPSPAPTQHSASTYAQPYSQPQYGYTPRQQTPQQRAPQWQQPSTQHYAQQGGGYGYTPGGYRD